MACGLGPCFSPPSAAAGRLAVLRPFRSSKDGFASSISSSYAAPPLSTPSEPSPSSLPAEWSEGIYSSSSSSESPCSPCCCRRVDERIAHLSREKRCRRAGVKAKFGLGNSPPKLKSVPNRDRRPPPRRARRETAPGLLRKTLRRKKNKNKGGDDP